MTQDNDKAIPEHGSSQPFSEDDAQARRIQQVIDDGQEDTLSDEDYQYAIRNGLIEG